MPHQSQPDEAKKKSSLPPERQRWQRSLIGAKEQKEIDERLTAIYQNDDGELPDMKNFEVRQGSVALKIFAGILTAIVIASGAAWVYFFVITKDSSTSTAAVALSFKGPEKTPFGVTTTFALSYTNKSQNILTKSTLTVRFPIGFVLATSSLPLKKGSKNEWELIDIPPQTTRQLSISGMLYGAEGQTRSWRSFLTYQPENINSLLQESASFQTTISESPYSLTISGPTEVTPHTSEKFTFSVITKKLAFDRPLEIIPDWPENFVLASSSPVLPKTGRWSISPPLPTSTLTFTAQGTFNDSPEKNQNVKGDLVLILPQNNQSFSIGNSTLNTTLGAITNSALSLAINGSTNETLVSTPGAVLTLTLNFKNTTPSTLKDGAFHIVFQTPSIKRTSVLNWGKLTDPLNGDIRGEQISPTIRQGTITWTKKNLPGLSTLAPGQELSLQISIPVKEQDLFDLAAITERSITVTGGATFATASGTLQTFNVSPHTITLGSDLSFESRDTVTTNTTDGENHAITWILSHSFNGLKNIRVTAEVYGNVKIAPSSTPSAGAMSFDAQTKHIIWVVPEMPETVDVLALPFSISLPNKDPSQTILISAPSIEADDAVTGQHLQLTGNPTSL
jgi:hypothetical protein